MKDWRIVQELFHRLNPNPEGDRTMIKIIKDEEIIENTIRHFYEYVPFFIYPAKSYFVAILYAKWISKDFNENFYQLLDDEMLLAGNDPFFIRYSESREIYNSILERVSINNIDETIGMIPDVRKYYEEEFRLWYE
jgi:hypothetical protein